MSRVHRKQASQGPSVFTLHPGDVACGESGDRFETLLGSCVAIILTDPRRTVGTMCHIVHSPDADDRRCNTSACGHVALETMHALLIERGISPRLCEAYVYGGGNMFPHLYRTPHVGDQNIRWALEALERDAVPVLSHDVGGPRYRRLSWTVGPQTPLVEAVSI